MPAIYSHDKFGKLVIKELSNDIKKVIKKYPSSFRIGLQGPDFMFFYRAFHKNKLNQLGRFYHHDDAYYFMEDAIDVIRIYGRNSPEYSYILGFICHLALDDACHPFVTKFMKSTGCSHAEIEGDMEQLLISMDGFAPSYYPVYELVPANYKTASSMEPFYKELTTQQIYKCLKWMRFLKKLFVAPSFIKRNTIYLIAKITGQFKSFKGHVIEENPNVKCRKESVYLYKRMKTGVALALNLINAFNDSLDSDKTLSREFHRNFYKAL